MKTIDFWFDPISPYAWLAFERLPQVLEGCSYVVNYRPVLLAGLLRHHAHKGPAEIEPKRQWTLRQVQWLAHQSGVQLQAPAVHPFNPLALLRLALACGPSRQVVETVFRHVWCAQGADAADPSRLAALTEQLAPTRDPASADVKAELKAELQEATATALVRGVFGVPSFEMDGRVFWGLDALPMLREALLGDPWFDGPDWAEAGAARPGVQRH